MAYSDTVGDNAFLLKRTVFGVTDFTGRSRRTEVLYYWIATLLLGTIISFLLMPLSSSHLRAWVRVCYQVICLTPSFALLARRLHDQDRSRWWGLLLPLAVLLQMRGADVDGLIPENVSLSGLMLEVVCIALLVLFLLPGTPGPNRFGPDPRLEHS